MSDFVQQNASMVNFSTSDVWVILSPIELSIKKKIEAVGTPLKDWDINIYRGVLTGYNEAFIVSTEVRNQILANCADESERVRTAELIRPILRGRDIKRYGYDWAGLWLIWIPWHFPYHLDNSIKGASEHAELAFKTQYPAIYYHLLQYKDKLSARNKAETGIRYEWYALQRWGANYWDDFSKPKIVYREISVEMEACIAPANWMLNNKLYMITSNTEDLKYICTFLNSKIFSKVIMSSVNFGGGKGVDFLGNVLLPRIEGTTKENADVILKLYETYELTEEEIRFIEFQ